MIARTVPLISVVLPVFNGARYIRDSVLSVLQQSVSDIELIVIDDGSTDDTLDIVKKICRSDNRVKYISRDNRGLVYSLNEGIQCATGKWIARMDADDICLRNRLSLQLKHAQENELDVCGGAIRTFGACRSVRRSYPINNDAIRMQLLFNTAFAHPTMLIKSAVYRAHQYRTEWEKIEDYELWTRIANSGASMGNTSEVVLNYRKTFGQITSKARALQDELRPKIAELYRKDTWGQIPSSFVKCFHSRSLSLSDSDYFSVVDFFVERISGGLDVEDVFKTNLKIFLLHHPDNDLSSRSRDIRSILSCKDYFALRLLKMAKIGHSSPLWNFLYSLR